MSKADAIKLINNVDRGLKSVNYMLKTTVADKDFHQDLLSFASTKLECVEGAMIYCKIPCKGEFSPCTVRITQIADVPQDVRAFVSKTERKPGPLNGS